MNITSHGLSINLRLATRLSPWYLKKSSVVLIADEIGAHDSDNRGAGGVTDEAWVDMFQSCFVSSV